MKTWFPLIPFRLVTGVSCGAVLDCGRRIHCTVAYCLATINCCDLIQCLLSEYNDSYIKITLIGWFVDYGIDSVLPAEINTTKELSSLPCPAHHGVASLYYSKLEPFELVFCRLFGLNSQFAFELRLAFRHLSFYQSNSFQCKDLYAVIQLLGIIVLTIEIGIKAPPG